MALVNCPECGREVSTTAVSCPGCGYVLQPSHRSPDTVAASDGTGVPATTRQEPANVLGVVFVILSAVWMVLLYFAVIADYNVGEIRRRQPGLTIIWFVFAVAPFAVG